MVKEGLMKTPDIEFRKGTSKCRSKYSAKNRDFSKVYHLTLRKPPVGHPSSGEEKSFPMSRASEPAKNAKPATVLRGINNHPKRDVL